MPAGSPVKLKDASMVDAVLELCFTGNEKIWDRRSPERKFLEKLKRGEASITSDGQALPAVIKIFQGLLLASFCVFPGIANSLLWLDGPIKENVLTLVLEKGRRLKLELGSWSADLAELLAYYKQKVLGWNDAPADLGKEDWAALRDAFKYSKLRLEGERTFLQGLIGPAKKINTIVSDPDIRMDSLLVLLSLLPAEQLNMFFIEMSGDIPDRLTAATPDGMIIDVKNYFSQSSVDIGNLFRKIRVLLMLYARRELLIDYVILEKTRSLLLKYLENDKVRQEVMQQAEKAIYGQYQPRLDIAKALAKLLS